MKNPPFDSLVWGLLRLAPTSVGLAHACPNNWRIQNLAIDFSIAKLKPPPKFPVIRYKKLSLLQRIV